ncbi:hypothetical protein ABTY61_32825 [Kitasatospora sp. NPDC096128]|uniref:hypothetical protein n=1 Tax=Kitasatospora sp. NPDC096128 TaxID=3155547 RepID=UPI003325CF07
MIVSLLRLSFLKRLSMAGVAAVTAGAVLTTVAPTASAAPAVPAPYRGAAAVASPQPGAVLDQGLVDRLVADIRAAKGSLATGESAVVHSDGTSVLTLTREVDGSFVLAGTTAGAAPGVRGFCHWSAMAAVYTIGAAAFAAAAALGGITVVGIAISAEAANALSIALATGGGVSGLVSEFVC